MDYIRFCKHCNCLAGLLLTLKNVICNDTNDIYSPNAQSNTVYAVNEVPSYAFCTVLISSSNPELNSNYLQCLRLLFLPFCSFTILPVPTLSLSDSFPHMTHLQGCPELKHEVREFVLGSHSFFVSFIHTPPHCQQHLPYPPSDHRFLAGEKLLNSRKY